MPHKKLITKVLQRYWRFSRVLSLEVRACVCDATGRVLLVRDGPAEPWRLPGGPVLRGETAAMAVKRWLALEADLEMTSDPRLYSVHEGKAAGHSDQVALYLILNWRDLAAGPTANRGFFAPGRLPHGVGSDTLEWLNDANEARTTL